jgi:hypothetical protein
LQASRTTVAPEEPAVAVQSSKRQWENVTEIGSDPEIRPTNTCAEFW